MIRHEWAKGQVFGRLTVETAERATTGKYNVVTCKCSCGAVVKIRSYNLLTKQSKSCGCLQRELIATRNKRSARLPGK